MEIYFIFVSLFVLLALGIPISVSLFLSGMVGYVTVIGLSSGINALAQTAYGVLDSLVISAIPLYVFMGQIMLKGGAGRDLFDFAQIIVGRVAGGLAVAAIVASAIFAAISGSSTATVATIGSISIPEMRRRGYDPRMAAGVVAVSGSLGILIPPSISFILYSLVTNTSVGKLFLAGILPGIMLALLFIVYTVVAVMIQRKRPQASLATDTEVAAHVGESVGTGASPSTPLRLNGNMFLSLFMIPLVLGGIYAGVFTPTEAAAVGTIYALILTLFFKRTLDLKLFWKSARDTVLVSSMILLLIAGAGVFGNALSLMQLPQALAAWLETLRLSQWEFLIAISFMYLFLGMFMDAAAAILITVPILLPALIAQDINLIWFGVILVINMEIGTVTPPVGLNLFVVKSLHPDYTLADILIGAAPYALMGLVGLALVIIFPQIALFLPNNM
ncbi:TRAP transporter large permease subunit (plasmid) [Marinobacter sp. M3C]|uniref:TRAP transporter large permease n=1 Tax=Marinobacter sp. M3C TaxID=2917715 RepID=UPI0020104FBD|nr:TRAP transporter large permease subunit [Marinobacter sp. M3C]UQG62674.1 TRAP transporter large permease subunit [Marinobacter sp. M3C]